MKLKKVEDIKQVFEIYGGLLRTSELYAQKIFYKDLRKLVSDGYIEKVRYGYYQWLDEDNPSEARLINQLFPDGVLNIVD